MATENFKLDFEIIILFVAAVTLSVFLTGETVSNALFTSLIVVLFFMKGLHMNLSKLRKNRHKRKEVILAGAISYVIFPVLGLAMYTLNSGVLGTALLIVSFSAAAIGPSIVWSSRAKANSETASIVSIILLFPGFISLIILLNALNIPVAEFGFEAFKFAFIPFILGYYSRNISFGILEDIKHHTARVSVWLIFLVGMIQFQALAAAQGLGFMGGLIYSIIMFALITFVMVFFGYNIAFSLGWMERKSRAVGIVSGSKSFGIALLVASQIGGEAVLYIFSYYIVRQIVMEFLVMKSDEDEFFHF